MPAHHPALAHAIWRKSSRSSTTGQNCVEAATSLRGVVALRDSKNPSGEKLIFTHREWVAFTREVKDSDAKSC